MHYKRPVLALTNLSIVIESPVYNGRGVRWKKIASGSHFPMRTRVLSYSRSVILCLMLLSGDMATNLGPTRCPCSVCEKPVRSNQKALSCDSCTLWTHCKCAIISNDTYKQHQKNDTLFWMCPRCLALSLPFNNCSAITIDMNLSCTQNSSLSSIWHGYLHNSPSF